MLVWHWNLMKAMLLRLHLLMWFIDSLVGAYFGKVPAWRSGSELDSIDVVTLRRARLVPGWVTVFVWVNLPGTEWGIQVDSAWAIPPGVNR